MSVPHPGRRALACLAALALPALAPAAESFSPPKGVATLTLKATITGSGVDRPASHERNVTWSVDNAFDVKATMIAQAPGGYPGLHKADAATQANLQQRAAAAQSAQGDMSGMMAAAQKAADKCGEDQDCLMREVQKMSQSVDPAKVQSAKDKMAVATRDTGNRYQVFQPDKQSGGFRVAEKSHEAYYDAACKPSTEAGCSTDTTVKGEGAQSDGNGNRSFQGSAMAEYDASAGTLVVQLPATGVGQASRSVSSTANPSKNGTVSAPRFMPTDAVKAMQTVSCGACRSASGKLTVPVTDQLLRRPATLVIEWSFQRP